MEIHFLNQDDLSSLKINIDSNVKFYMESDNTRLFEQLGHNPLVSFKKEVGDFILDPFLAEVDNARNLYSSMSNLTDSEATDERLWAGLTHGAFWDFMKNTVTIDVEENTRNSLGDKLLLNRYFFNIKENAKKRSIYINSLSKLWWAGRLTYDKQNKQNPYASLELFRTAFSHKMINTFSSNFMANPDIRFAVFDTFLELQNGGITIKGDTMIPVIRYLNELGGKVLLDSFSREEWYTELRSYAIDHLDEIRSR